MKAYEANASLTYHRSERVRAFLMVKSSVWKRAAYAAAPSVLCGFGVRSSRATRCTRISVTDFFAPSFATYSRGKRPHPRGGTI